MPLPLFGWVGGKVRQIKTLFPFFPDKYRVYVEPFVGGASVFFNLCKKWEKEQWHPESVILSDKSNSLITTYKQIQSNPFTFIGELRKMPYNDKQFFNELKKQKPADLNDLQRALQFYYIVKFAYGSSWKLYPDGRIRTWFGRTGKVPRDILFPNDKDILRAHVLFQRVTFRCDDFEQVINDTMGKDVFMYIDPPYIMPSMDKFSYVGEVFSIDEHKRLANALHRASQAGTKFVASNSNDPAVYEIYHGFSIQEVDVSREMASRYTDKVGRIRKEVVIFN